MHVFQASIAMQCRSNVTENELFLSISSQNYYSPDVPSLIHPIPAFTHSSIPPTSPFLLLIQNVFSSHNNQCYSLSLFFLGIPSFILFILCSRFLFPSPFSSSNSFPLLSLSISPFLPLQWLLPHASRVGLLPAALCHSAHRDQPGGPQ